MCRNVVKGAWGSEQECGIEIASCMLICCNFSDLAQGSGSLSRGYVLQASSCFREARHAAPH